MPDYDDNILIIFIIISRCVFWVHYSDDTVFATIKIPRHTLLWSLNLCHCINLLPFSHAHDVNISTITKNNNTLFYLQAGAFSLEKDANARQKELAAQISQTVEIKIWQIKHLYLVQVGPIDDYQNSASLKRKVI